MSIKQSESRSGLKSKLASRSLEFEDSELEEALKKYNLFNGIESILLSKTNPEIMGAVTILQTLGVLSGVNLMFVVKMAYSYISTVNDTKKQFNSIWEEF